MEAQTSAAPATIRPYSSEDLQACRSLWAELTEWHRSIYHSPEIGGPDPGCYFDEHLKRVGSEHIWVADMDGRVVGLAGMIPGEEEAELEPLVVSEPYRSRGIGQQLVETVIAAVRILGVQQLIVRPVARNELAIRFFHQKGFDILGRIELFMDLEPVDRQVWRSGERMANRDFRV
jgi:N-acetylglutamate synthase-like GNAT family acetyltransferase